MGTVLGIKWKEIKSFLNIQVMTTNNNRTKAESQLDTCTKEVANTQSDLS